LMLRPLYVIGPAPWPSAPPAPRSLKLPMQPDHIYIRFGLVGPITEQK
jgi:hypothetical protein